MFPFRSLFVLLFLGAICSLRAAGPPVSATPGAIRLGADRLRIGDGGFIVAPDGKTLASSEVGSVCLWDLPSGKVRRRFEYAECSEGQPHAFCSESRWLAVSLNNWRSGPGYPSSFSVFDTRSGSRFSLMERNAAYFIPKAAFLNRGRSVCCFVELNQDPHAPLADYGLHVWALPSGKKLGRIGDATCFATAPGSSIIVTGHDDGSVRFYDARSLTCLASVPAHSASVCSLAVSPDGRLAASSCKFRDLTGKKPRGPRERVAVWDVPSRKRLRRLGELEGGFDLFFATNDVLCSEARMYNARTGRAIPTTPIDHHSLWPPAFSADGAEVAFVRQDGRVELRRVSGKGSPAILRGTPPEVSDMAFANGGRSIVVRGAAAVPSSPLGPSPGLGGGGVGIWCGVWDRATGAALPGGAGHRAKILRVAYSQDGKTLASLDAAGELRLSHLPGGTPHPSFTPAAAGWVMDFRRTPDGDQLCAIGLDGHAAFWDMTTGKRRRSVDLIGKGLREALPKRRTPFWEWVQFSPLGKNLTIDPTGRVAVVRCSDTSLEAVRLDSGERTRIPFAPPRDYLRTTFALSHGGRYLAASQNDRFELWDLSKSKRLLESSGGTAFAFSVDGRCFAWGDGSEVRLFDLTKRKTVGSLPSNDEWFTARELAFDIDGKTLAARDDSRIIYWALETKHRLGKGWTRHPSEVPMVPLRAGLILSPHTFIDQRRWLRVIDARTGMGFLPRREYAACEEDRVVAVSPDGRIVAVGGRIVTLIEGDTGRLIGRLPRYHRGVITAMAFSPDGRTLTTGGTDAAVFVWDWRRFEN